jgi:hypothetical protein
VDRIFRDVELVDLLPVRAADRGLKIMLGRGWAKICGVVTVRSSGAGNIRWWNDWMFFSTSWLKRQA